MAKSHISKRIIFAKGKQREFLARAKMKLNISWTALAQFLGVSNRTLTDWKQEKFSASLNAVKRLCRKTKLPTPTNVEVRHPFWYASRGASAGGIAVYKKYGRVGGDPAYRKRKWYAWWERKGKYQKHLIVNVSKPIQKPHFSQELAEFTGIMLGDGGISQNQVTITLNAVDDRKYCGFVAKLITYLFGLKPSIYKDPANHVIDIVVSRKNLVKFCTQKLGLVIGNKVKQQVNIPKWIKRNKTFKIACVRGLIDTDGCVVIHQYEVNGTRYIYKKLAFTNHSYPLVESVHAILQEIGLHPRFAKKNRDVWLDNQKDVQKYFHIVSSHNPKHLKRYAH